MKASALTHKQGKTGAITFIQRFGSALNLNIHFHMLFLDGCYVLQEKGKVIFHKVPIPTVQELTALTQKISERIASYLERQGLLVRDMDNSYLSYDNLDEDALGQIQGNSITYRIAVGPQAGQKVFTLQTLLAQAPMEEGKSKVAKVAGFSLHAGVASQAHQRKKLERLCRYVSRSAVSEQRIQLTDRGKIRYELKTPYRNGTTHVIFEPLDFIARLAALVPKPRVNLTRFHGVFAPNSNHRKLVTSDKKEAKKTAKVEEGATHHTEAEQRRGMTWAQRLKRVFDIDIQTCAACGGFVKVIACIEEPELIKKILAHVNHKPQAEQDNQLPALRAPPQIQGNLFN